MHKYILTFVAGFAAAGALLLSLVAFGQTDVIGHIRPTVINIQQSVPVLADIDGATVPITVDLSLQVALSGPITASVVDTAPPVVQVAETPPRPAGGTDIASAQPLDYKEVARYTEDHIGEVYSFRARVYDVREGDTKLSAGIEGAEKDDGAAVIWRNPGQIRVLPDDTVDMIAEVTGRIWTGYGDKPEFTALSIEIVND